MSYYSNFVGFDNIEYSFSDFKYDVSTFKHSVFIKGSIVSVLCFFNEKIEFLNDGSNIYVTVDDGISTGCFFRKHATLSYWERWDKGNPLVLGTNYTVIYSSEELFQYKDEFLSVSNVGYSTIIEPIEVSLYSVAPQVQNIEMNVVLSEVVGILPVLIVVLVSIIGLRKAIAFLFSLLRCS